MKLTLSTPSQSELKVFMLKKNQYSCEGQTVIESTLVFVQSESRVLSMEIASGICY